LGIIISSTGAIKLAAYYYSVALQLTHIATQIHDISARLFVLVLIIHILIAVIVSSNRRLLASFFINKLK
jgi:cytochrome b subunit of formate dehydrogenase